MIQAIDRNTGSDVGSVGSAATDPRLARSAHEFEASLMGELLKPLQQSDGLTGEAEDQGSESALTGLATESLARVLSERGGLGIADRVLHELNGGTRAATPHTETTQVAGATPDRP